MKAGLSDCASVEHVCAEMNTDDSSETDWLWLPIGTCNKIIGAHTLKASKPDGSEKLLKKDEFFASNKFITPYIETQAD